MTAQDYERLLGELTAATEARDGDEAERRHERRQELVDLEDRLLDQQAELLTAAGRLGIRSPRLAAVEQPGGNPTRSLAEATRQAATADAALAAALRRGRQPRFLPRQRPPTRHAVVYLISAVAAAVLQVALLAGSSSVAEVSWVFLAAPAVAWCAGYLAAGAADRPHIRPDRQRGRKRERTPTRDPRTGLIICLVVDAVISIWWLVG